MSKMKSEGLAFDGAAGTGVNRSSNPYAKNQWSGHSNDGRGVNYGRGPTKGNNGECPGGEKGKSVTKDAYRRAPDTAKGAVTGRRDWMPAAGQNYKGNPDKINLG